MEKILILSRNLNTYQSAPKCNYNLALSLAKFGVEVHILTSNIDTILATHFLKEKIKTYKIPHIFSKKWFSPVIYTLMHRNIHPRLGNGYTLFDDITWLHFLRRAMIKTMGTLLTDAQINNLLKESMLEDVILKSSKYIWSVSNMMAELLQRLYKYPKRKIFVLYNGVNVSQYYPMPSKERRKLRESMEIDDKLVILFVGEDPLRKGFLPLVKAINNLPQKKHIILFGAGFSLDSIYPYLRGHDLGNIKILGKVSTIKLKRFYQLSDVIAVPSYFDPFSLTVLEGMASGNIALVSKLTGASEIIDNNIDGFVINPYNSLSIELALKELLRIDLSYHRRKAVEKARKFSWDNIAKELITLATQF